MIINLSFTLEYPHSITKKKNIQLIYKQISHKVDQDILIAETAFFYNLEGVESKTANTVANYIQSNFVCETLAHFSGGKNHGSYTCNFLFSREVILILILRRLKTYLRPTMGQDRLSALGPLCIERGHANRVDNNIIVDVFWHTKGKRQKVLLIYPQIRCNLYQCNRFSYVFLYLFYV